MRIQIRKLRNAYLNSGFAAVAVILTMLFLQLSCLQNKVGTQRLCPDVDKMFRRSEIYQAQHNFTYWIDSSHHHLEALYDHFPTNFHGFNNETDAALAHDHARFSMLGPVGPPCLSMVSFGQKDEEKRVCSYSASDDCVVISLGGANKWAFETDVVQRTKCVVHTYDCTVDLIVPDLLKDRVFSHHVCIGKSDGVFEGRNFLTWASISRSLEMKRPPAHLKMDIEGYEFDVIQEIILTGENLPMQISLELHYLTQMPGLSWYGRLKSAGEIAVFMASLHQHGYYLIDRNDNPGCLHCTEVLLARLVCS